MSYIPTNSFGYNYTPRVPLSFCDLLPYIHLEISSYLSGIDNKNVSQTCNAVRQIYLAVSWKTCIVSKKFREGISQANGFNRVLPFRVFHSPQNYRIWFRTEDVETLQFDFHLKNMAYDYEAIRTTITMYSISLFPSLRRIDISGDSWVDLKKVLENNVLRMVPYVGISSVTFGYSDWLTEYDDNMKQITELKAKPSAPNDANRFSTLLPIFSNLTKLEIGNGSIDVVESMVNSLLKISLPNLQDFTFCLFVGYKKNDSYTTYSSFDLKSLPLLDNSILVKSLKRFKIKFVHDFSKKYSYSDICNISSLNGPITVFNATHVQIQYGEHGDNIALLNKSFEFPNVSYFTIDNWNNREDYGIIDRWVWLFSHLSYLSLTMSFHYLSESDMTSTLDYICSLGCLVSLKKLCLKICTTSELNPNICSRPIDLHYDTMEGSIFGQTCKILRATQDMYVHETPEEYTMDLMTLIRQEFPFISVYNKKKPQILNGGGMKVDYIAESRKKGKQSEKDRILEAKIRGFFIYWLHVLLTDSKKFFEYFSTEYAALSRSSFTIATTQNIEQRFKGYVEMGKVGTANLYRNYANLRSVVEFLFSVAVSEKIYSSLPFGKNLQFLEISLSTDFVPSPSLEYYIQNSGSLKQVLIRTPLYQPFDGLTSYCDEEKLQDFFGPWVKDLEEITEESGSDSYDTMLSSYNLSGHPHYDERWLGADSIDPDIFPRPPVFGKREIFWSGTVAECASNGRIGKPGTVGLNTYSNAVAVYSLDMAAGEFNHSYNIADQAHARYLDNCTGYKYFVVRDKENVDGWF